METLKNFYLQVDSLLLEDMEQIRKNKKRLLKNNLYKDMYNHLMDIIPDKTSIELLTNINYHSIIWEYLRNTDTSQANGLFQDFKSILYNGIEYQSTSKLNNLHYFNNTIYKLIKA